MKYQWWYCVTNGMVGKHKSSPGPEWKGPYAALRDLKAANTPTWGEVIKQLETITQNDLQAENARLRAALHMIEGAVLPVQTELGMVAVEDVQELIDIAADALKGGAQ